MGGDGEELREVLKGAELCFGRRCDTYRAAWRGGVYVGGEASGCAYKAVFYLKWVRKVKRRHVSLIHTVHF